MPSSPRVRPRRDASGEIVSELAILRVYEVGTAIVAAARGTTLPTPTEENGFTGIAAELVFDTSFPIDHVARLDRRSEEGLLVFSDRRNEGGVPFRFGDCVLLTGSSGRYAGTRTTAAFD